MYFSFVAYAFCVTVKKPFSCPRSQIFMGFFLNFIFLAVIFWILIHLVNFHV